MNLYGIVESARERGFRFIDNGDSVEVWVGDERYVFDSLTGRKLVVAILYDRDELIDEVLEWTGLGEIGDVSMRRDRVYRSVAHVLVRTGGSPKVTMTGRIGVFVPGSPVFPFSNYFDDYIHPFIDVSLSVIGWYRGSRLFDGDYEYTVDLGDPGFTDRLRKERKELKEFVDWVKRVTETVGETISIQGFKSMRIPNHRYRVLGKQVNGVRTWILVSYDKVSDRTSEFVFIEGRHDKRILDYLVEEVSRVPGTDISNNGPPPSVTVVNPFVVSEDEGRPDPRDIADKLIELTDGVENAIRRTYGNTEERTLTI